MKQTPQLYVATYHYVRDLPSTRFPRLKGMLLDDFRKQVKSLPRLFEMATVNSMLEFLAGNYQPRRDLCLMTFDDGLKEHYAEVTPILLEQRIQGVFFPITSCMEDKTVAAVHMNHFLLATLEFERYRTLFMNALHVSGFGEHTQTSGDQNAARCVYPLDNSEVAEFKYLFNFILPFAQRDAVVKNLFEERIQEEAAFANTLYLSWAEAREMQQVGMVIGGHSHVHRPLATLEASDLNTDLDRCQQLLHANLRTQEYWPFSYPYGKSNSFDGRVVAMLRRLGFCCSLCTDNGMNLPGVDLFAIRRVDCKQIMSVNQWKPHPPLTRTKIAGVSLSGA